MTDRAGWRPVVKKTQVKSVKSRIFEKDVICIQCLQAYTIQVSYKKILMEMHAQIMHSEVNIVFLLEAYKLCTQTDVL